MPYNMPLPSYLIYFMPRSIIALIDEEDDESFSSLLQSKCVRPNVLWGEQVRDFRQNARLTYSISSAPAIIDTNSKQG